MHAKRVHRVAAQRASDHIMLRSIKGMRAVVVGRSNIVGMPVALLLQSEDATISDVHSRTKNPEEIIKQADIVIAAVGQANMVRGSWIKPGDVIIDVRINPVEDAKSPRGHRLVGDVCYEEASKVASAMHSSSWRGWSNDYCNAAV